MLRCSGVTAAVPLDDDPSLRQGLAPETKWAANRVLRTTTQGFPDPCRTSSVSLSCGVGDHRKSAYLLFGILLELRHLSCSPSSLAWEDSWDSLSTSVAKKETKQEEKRERESLRDPPVLGLLVLQARSYDTHDSYCCNEVEGACSLQPFGVFPCQR